MQECRFKNEVVHLCQVRNVLLVNAKLLGRLEELANTVHPDEEPLVDVKRLPRLLLVHVEILFCNDNMGDLLDADKIGTTSTKKRTQEVYDPVIVAREEPDEVSEEEHEGAVDDAVVEVLSRGLKVEERVELFVGIIS